ncbi:MAG: glycosyltransferase family A protein [Bacteroidaceae bacterium]
MKALFSIIIPVYNRSEYIARTYASIKAQSYRPLELILVDNASTDTSLALCKALQKNNLEEGFTIKVIEESKQGASIARNTGLQEATGTYVSFFDSDDEMSSTFIADAAKIFTEKNCDVVAMRTRMIFPNGHEQVRKSFFNQSVSDQILIGMLSTVSMILKTDFAKSIGGWNEKLTIWDDWEFGIRVLLASPQLQWIKKKVYHRLYQHDDSITGTKISNSLQHVLLAMGEVEDYIKKSTYSKKRSAINALVFRYHILAGFVFQEHECNKALMCIHLAQKSDVSWIAKQISSMLYLYTRLGGRGTWFIARLFIKL